MQYKGGIFIKTTYILRMFLIGAIFILITYSRAQVDREITAVTENFSSAPTEEDEKIKEIQKAGISAFIKTVEARALAFPIDPLISTEEEMKEKRLLTQEELYQLASAVNEAGEFGYIISDYTEYVYETHYDPETTRMVLIEDKEHEISGLIIYQKYSNIHKSLSFESTPEETKATYKMLEFGKLMFDNMPNKIFEDFYGYEDIDDLKYHYINGDIVYRNYLDYYEHFPDGPAIRYSLEQSYGTYKSYKDFFDNELIIKVKDLPYYTLYKGRIAIKGHIYNIRLDETELYYHGVLVDEDGNAIPCKIDPFRTKDTVADIRNAKIFYGSCRGILQYPETYYYTVKFYK